MNIRSLPLGLITAASMSLSSCATRLSCASDAPDILHRRSTPFQAVTDEAKVASYSIGHQSPDGYVLRNIRKITILPSCGMDLMATAFTLGLVPHAAPQPVKVTVTLVRDGHTVDRTYRLLLDQNTSIWHSLAPRSSDSRVMARALLQAVDRNQLAVPIALRRIAQLP